MDSSKKHDRRNPKKGANPLSKLFFVWLMGLFRKGYKKELEEDDLFNILKEDRSERVGGTLEKNWNRELLRAQAADREPSLFRALAHTFWGWYLFFGTIMTINMVVVKVGQPLLLGKLLRYFRGAGGVTHEQAYYYAGGLTLLGFIMPFLMHQFAMGAYFIGMRARVACCSLLYRKVLRLNKSAMGQTATGQIVNLMSNDVARFDQAAWHLIFLVITPVQIPVIAYFLWSYVQVSSLIGLAFIFAQTLPVQAVVGNMTAKLRLRIAIRTDDRVRLMSEIIQGVQVIKMYAWEKPFALLVEAARKREIDVVTKVSYLRGMYLSFMIFSERSALFATLTAYVLLGGTITSDKVFALASFYSLLNQSMAIYFPNAVSLTLETSVSIKRMQAFMLRDEIDLKRLTAAPGKGPIEPVLITDSTKPVAPVKDNPTSGLVVERATAKWSDDLSTPTLRDVTFTVRPGQLCSVIGQVGSGKSSLLHALLGELALTAGSVSIGGGVSYASQEPWLFVGSVRNNILFGQEYDAQRYRRVIKVCALQRDLELFPHGDQTMVGERGVSLSGGQRARINLARAVYKDADVYLLDDPLSAVDAHVGKHIFEECIKGYLHDKTVVLVTHQLHLLKNSDLIVVFENGAVLNQGTYNQVLKTGAEFAQLLRGEEGSEEGTAAARRKSSAVSDSKGRSTSIASIVSSIEENAEQEAGGEGKTAGQVTWGTYGSYFRAGGSVCFLTTVVFMLVLGQGATSGADYWVSFWTREEEKTNGNVTVDGHPYYRHVSRDWSIGIYAALVLTCTVVTITRSLMFFKMCMRASIGLHNTMFSSILRATMHFFDTNPSGRILNRFSKDMGSVDELLPKAMIEATQVLLVMSGVMLLIVIANYWLVIPLLIIAGLFFVMRIVYLSTARNVKRLEGITRSPVFSHLSATLDGLTTIRANHAQEMLRREFDSHQNLHTSSWFLFVGTGTAFGFYLDLISALFSGVVAFSFVLLDKLVSGASAGLAISQSMQMTGILQYGIRQSAEVVSQMTSVERVLEYTHVEKESDSDVRPPKGWPSKGEVRFEHMSLSYAPGEPAVLRDLNFTIQPKHKVGIVGRTGAGKSSLIAALFRLALQEGAVVVDGVDTKTLGLMHLRSNIAIIPQEPVLFSATIRDNLDPFNQYEDHQLWAALEEVELKEAMGSLDFLVNEGGSNFSVGQRQLVCLARAILRNNRILVLDEATANVDPQTDALIQATIRRRFSECTVLTIAHRLNTVMDSDRVLVMDAGQMKEFDHPHLLLQRKGALWSMVQETGPGMAEQLATVAAKCYAKEIGANAAHLDVVPVHGGTVEKQHVTPVKAGSFAEARNEVARDATRESPKKATQELPQETFQESPKQSPEKTLHEMPKDLPKDVTLDDTKEEIPKEVSLESPKSVVSTTETQSGATSPEVASYYEEEPVKSQGDAAVGEEDGNDGTSL